MLSLKLIQIINCFEKFNNYTLNEFKFGIPSNLISKIIISIYIMIFNKICFLEFFPGCTLENGNKLINSF